MLEKKKQLALNVETKLRARYGIAIMQTNTAKTIYYVVRVYVGLIGCKKTL
jgi:hypothetical protein